MNEKILIILESSYLLKNFLSSIKIDNKEFNDIEFLATNGSIFKYRNEKKELKAFTLNQNIENKIRYFNGNIIVATDHDQNGHLIALEIASLRNDCLRLNLNIDEIFKQSKNGLILNKEYFFNNSTSNFNLNNSLNFLAKKMLEEFETKEFYLKYGIKLSIDDRILLKILKGNINNILQKPEWLNNVKKNNKDIYLYLASTLELNKDIEKIYEDSLKEYEKGNLSYFRTNGISHNFIEITNNLMNYDIQEILDYILNIDFKKISKEEYHFLTNNIFILAKLYNIGTPATIFYIYKNVLNNKDLVLNDDIDILRRINNKEIISKNIDIKIDKFDMNKLLGIVEKIINKENKVEENINEENINEEIKNLFF